VHAAGESSPGNLPSGTFAVVLAVSSEAELERFSARLVDADLVHYDIREVDEPYCGQMMAIGLRPIMRSVGRKVLSNLPLYRGPVSAGCTVHGVGSKPHPAPIHGGVAQL
jgi:hypothetical protein